MLRGRCGGWFEESIGRKVGSGRDTFFWMDPCLGGQPLRRRFRRMFDLAENKSITVVKMGNLGWGREGMFGSGSVGCGRGRKRDVRGV